MPLTRTCKLCGVEVEIREIASGHRVEVNPGVIPVFVGEDGGAIGFARTLHVATCTGDQRIDVVGATRRVDIGAGLEERPKAKGRRA